MARSESVDRVVVVDALRGFALFPVFLGNFVWAGIWIAVPDAMRSSAPGASVNWVVTIPMGWFVVQKGLGLFSMLFGVSFALMLQALEARGANVNRLFSRRLVVLLLIGVFHIVFLWYGDILHMYALCGFFLFLVRKATDKVLLSLAVIFIVVIPLLTDLWNTLAPGAAASPPDYEYRLGLLTGGSVAGLVRANWRILVDIMQRNWVITTYSGVLGRLLLGYWLGRRQMLQRSEDHPLFWKRVLFVVLPLGLLINVLQTAYTIITNVEIVGKATLFGVAARAVLLAAQVAISLGYMGIFVFLWQVGFRRVVNWFAPAGRMALSNYLAQSVIMILIMYNVGVGLGLLGHLSAITILAIVCVLYLLQIVISDWWLKRYRFGPAEWAWRSLTYGKIQPLRFSG